MLLRCFSNTAPCCCSLALTHARTLLIEAERASEGFSVLLQAGIRWIMGVPAGLKLNDHLDLCLGNLCILGVEGYQVLLRASQV